MPKVTEEHIEARRRQILDAALACFSRNGFHQTTINDICEEANLSAGAIYNYFDSKDSMIAECCTHGQTEIGAVFDGAQLLGTAREAIEKLASASTELMGEVEEADQAEQRPHKRRRKRRRKERSPWTPRLVALLAVGLVSGASGLAMIFYAVMIRAADGH